MGMSDITVKILATDGEVLFDGREPDEQFVIDLAKCNSYDVYESYVREVIDMDLTGSTTARILLLLSDNFLSAHGEMRTLSSAELREQS